MKGKGIILKTDLNNQRQVFVEEYSRSGDHLDALKGAGYKDTHIFQNQPFIVECVGET